jgi:hypothetical protein
MANNTTGSTFPPNQTSDLQSVQLKIPKATQQPEEKKKK